MDYWNPACCCPTEKGEDSIGSGGYTAEFRHRLLDLVAAGRRVEDIARDLGISDQTVYSWPRQIESTADLREV